MVLERTLREDEVVDTERFVARVKYRSNHTPNFTFAHGVRWSSMSRYFSSPILRTLNLKP